MEYNEGKQKSFLQSFAWVGIMLLVLGSVFLGVAVVMQLVPLNPENMSIYSNGLRQPSTKETVRTFRLIFLLVFGILGLGMAIAGSIVAGRARAQRRLACRLKEEGVCLTAEVAGISPSAVRVNYRSLVRVRCSYTDFGGRTYIFKSGLLRMDPMPYLPQGYVNVYHERDNISRYFVDIDGSVGLGTRVVEL